MSEYDELRRQLEILPEPELGPTKITIPESGGIQIPDITQEVAPVLVSPTKKKYLCKCCSEGCIYTYQANQMAEQGYPDSSILMFLEQVQ